jgi:hypothetical protein
MSGHQCNLICCDFSKDKCSLYTCPGLFTIFIYVLLNINVSFKVDYY